jgi:anti-sigma factor RsiW
MNDHQRWRDLIPFYVSGSISDADRRALEIHLAGCPNCRAEADLWRSVAREVESSPAIAAAPVSPLDRALAQIERDRRRVHSNRLRLAFDLILGQAALLRPEIWISVAAVMGLCLAASLINGSSEALRFIGPLIAAASLAVIGGPQNDPAIELAQSTPVSPGKIILARATLVFGYNLVLSAAAGLLLGAVLPKETFFSLVRDGLSPMAFLSALALLLSLSIGTANAVAAACAVWILRLLPVGLVQQIVETLDAPILGGLAAAYRSVWERPILLFILAAGLTLAAIWRADRLGIDSRFLGRTS